MIIKLPRPQPQTVNSISLEAALSQRETKREYLDSAISLTTLSLLLSAGQGRRGNSGKLHAPSAQEQYPLTTYVAINAVTDLTAGLYQYQNSDHSMLQLEKGCFSERLAKSAIGEQPWVANAAAIIILTGDIQAMNQQFAAQAPLNKRGERYVYIEVGAVAQNIQLQGSALNIGMVLVGGFDNESVKSILKLPGELEASALLCLGNI